MLTPGSAVVDPVSGVVTKDGAAGAVYDALEAATPTAATTTGLTLRVSVRESLAALANNVGATLATYINSAGVGSYMLHFGATFGAAGTIARVNGANDATPATDAATCPRAGTLRVIAWATVTGNATTVLKVLKNAAVVETITLTGASGVAALNTPVVAGDRVGVEYDAGTAPGASTMSLTIDL